MASGSLDELAFMIRRKMPRAESDRLIDPNPFANNCRFADHDTGDRVDGVKEGPSRLVAERLSLRVTLGQRPAVNSDNTLMCWIQVLAANRCPTGPAARCSAYRPSASATHKAPRTPKTAGTLRNRVRRSKSTSWQA